MRNEIAYSALHLYVVQIDDALTPITRRQLFDGMRATGIGVNVHYIPVHMQPYYQRLGFSEGQFPVSERYYARCLSLPMFASLTDVQLDHVVEQLARLLQ